MYSDKQVPEKWRCWECEPRKVDKERAVRIQQMQTRTRQPQPPPLDVDKHKRRVSPGVERKPRKPNSTVQIVDGVPLPIPKRKRRISVSSHQHQPQQHTTALTEDEHIDIDEPASNAYIHIDTDLVPNTHTRDRLKRLAQHWRGHTALDSPSSLDPILLDQDAFPNLNLSQTTLRPLPVSAYSNSLSSNSNPSVLPPTTPKPFVHLLGPPLDVALDARTTGQESRFVRNGCRPNAILRPLICQRRQHRENGCDPSPSSSELDTLSFGVFALRDLKANEESSWVGSGTMVVRLPFASPLEFHSCHLSSSPYRLEQFRNQMSSMLHTLSSTFITCACGSKARDCALTRLAEFVDNQTPLTPSPSPPSLRQENKFFRDNIDREADRTRDVLVDLGPLVGSQRGFKTRERIPMSGGMSGVEMVSSAAALDPYLDASPGAGPSKLPHTGTAPIDKPACSARKGKARASDDEIELPEVSSRKGRKSSGKYHVNALNAATCTHPLALDGSKPHRIRRKTSGGSTQSEAMSRSTSDDSSSTTKVEEYQMPPKMRKLWMHRSVQALREKYGPGPPPAPDEVSEGAEGSSMMQVDDPEPPITNPMPPPPVPPAVLDPGPMLAPPMHDERLSPKPRVDIFSPGVVGPTPHYYGSRRSHSPLCVTTTHIPEREPTPPPRVVKINLDVIPVVPPKHVDTPSIRLPTPVPDPSPRSPSPVVRPPSPVDVILEDASPPAPSEQTSSNRDEEGEDVTMVDVTTEPPHINGTTATTPAEEQIVVSPRSPSPPPRSPSPSSRSPSPPPPKSPSLSKSPTPSPESPPPPLKSPSVKEVALPPASPTPTPKSPTPKSPTPKLPTPPPKSPSPPPPLPPPTKVKLSLKDFALRKRKQREEEAVKLASPVATQQTLPPEPELVEKPPAPQVSSIPPEPLATTLPLPESSVPVPQSNHVHPPANGDTISDPRVVNKMPPPVIEQPKPVHAVREDVLLNGIVGKGVPTDSSSLHAKVELIESGLPQPTVVVAEVKPVEPLKVEFPSLGKEGERNQRPPTSTSLAPPATPLLRQPSREDGEILSPPPQKPPPLAPRSHTPPTRPRFLSHSGAASPSSLSSLPPRRTVQSSSYRPSTQGSPPNSRIPSAPRALRNSGYSPPRSLAAPHHAPRGPSADRDRDWDRDRSWSSSRGRGRGSANGWSR
ncbi:hypothetical protein NLI96_g1924 [Meripilus lineatus]|uniref:Uncharacterized protein n=1 Tax=Meripilus lineatus TaxID=2056292 RepID=A0AAD5V9P6_9APHY|nr:hypothetical protein NLI96_g1924 [Physisporinus lineatus]